MRAEMTVIAIILWLQCFSKEKPDSINVMGAVYDAATEMPMSVNIMVSDTAGNVLRSNLIEEYVPPTDSRPYPLYRYDGMVPYRPQYLITVSANGYTPEQFIGVPHKIYPILSLERIYLRRSNSEKLLNEVVITATRVKMINKGDTLEYDATAFLLPKGSMLDDLINELPGAKIDADGRISVNGQFVSQLLLNGRDFMGDGGKFTMRNLPAFTVSNIQVYRQQPDEFRGRNVQRDNSDDPLVMDVNLKKEYLNGWIANAEAGIGSVTKDNWHTKWAGSLFAMRYNLLGHLSAYASANNVNATHKPGSNGEWIKPNPSAGETTIKRAGIEFNSDWKDQKHSGIKTSLDVIRNNSINQTVQDNTFFLSGGNIFNQSSDNRRADSWRFSWQGEVTRSKENLGRVAFTASIDYENSNDESGFKSEEGSSQSLIFQRFKSGQQKTTSFKTKAGLTLTLFRLPQAQSAKLHSSFVFNNNTNNQIGNDIIHYTQQSGSNVFMTQLDNKINHSYFYMISPEWKLNKLTLGENASVNFGINYTYEQSYKRRVRTLQEANEANEDNNLSALLNWTLNEANSYEYNELIKNNVINPNLGFIIGDYNIQISSRIIHSSRLLRDFREQIYSNVQRDDWWTYSEFKIEKGYWWNNTMRLWGSIQHELPDMYSLLNISDSANPLWIIRGNPSLEKAKKYEVGWLINKMNLTKRETSIFAEIKYNATDNSFTTSRCYNRETGVTTVTPFNVNGNWTTSTKIELSSCFDRSNRLSISETLSSNFIHSVEFTSDTDIPQKSKIRNWRINNNTKVGYRISKIVDLNAKVNFLWSKISSGSHLFSTMCYQNIDYGIGANIRLPGNYFIDTDFMVYSRMGYSSKNFNTSVCVWNIQLYKTFGSTNQWTIKAIGVDLLHQVQTVSYEVTPQGRTEVRYNSHPAYVLLTLAYRLDIKPKKN